MTAFEMIQRFECFEFEIPDLSHKILKNFQIYYLNFKKKSLKPKKKSIVNLLRYHSITLVYALLHAV